MPTRPPRHPHLRRPQVIGSRPQYACRVSETTEPSQVPIALSTASVYPDGVETGFRIASELGYDGVEIMVYTDPASQSAGALQRLQDRFGLPVTAIHAPTLLLTQRVMHAEPWPKIDLSIDLAKAVGAPTVVVHPPFRWQRVYAREFVDGVALRENDQGITIAVENMYPWRAGQRAMQAYLPHWDPVDQPYDNVTLDVSHASTARQSCLDLAQALGPRLKHIHLTDGTGSALDEHLVPGRGNQPVGSMLEHLAGSGFDGAIVLEVSTRRGTPDQRLTDLAESLAFARLNFAATVS